MSTRDVFDAIDPLTGDGLTIGLRDGRDLVVRARHADAERVVIVTAPGAARRLATRLIAQLDSPRCQMPRREGIR